MNNARVDSLTIANQRMKKEFMRQSWGLPIFVFVYGVLIYFGVIKGSDYFSEIPFIVVSTISFLVAAAENLQKEQTEARSIFFILINHFVFGFQLFFVFGVLSPVVLIWAILPIVTLVYLGKKAALASFAMLDVVLIINIIIGGDYSASVISEHILVSGSVGSISLLFVGLRNLDHAEQQKIIDTKQKQLQQREALLTLINGTAQPIFTLSANGKVRIYNAAFLSLLDTNLSISGKHIDDILHLQDANGEPVSLFELSKHKANFERDDLVMKFSDGDEIRLLIDSSHIQNTYSSSQTNKSDTFIFMLRDITKEKSLEEERDEFISVVSHELRTPIAITEGTISNVKFLMEKGVNKDAVATSIEDAHKQVVLLANMVNDLGTLSRAERGAGDDTEDIDVKDLAEGLYKKYEASAKEKGLKLDLEVTGSLGVVQTSRLYLEEMLQNLITNAIKYTHDGGVTIRVKKVGGGVEFAVKDTGIGISKTDLGHIFEKFYRSEDYRTRETGGTGLGLYVTHKLMKKLGTDISVESRLNHGSTFSFTLPSKTRQKTEK